MKIRDLVQGTRISKETVHYYIREGLLPKPRKRGRNIAEYNDSYVDRIRLSSTGSCPGKNTSESSR